jgi:hypothetical protein
VVRRVVRAVTVTRVCGVAVGVAAVARATVRAGGAASLGIVGPGVVRVTGGIVGSLALGDAADGVVSTLALANVAGGVVGTLALAHLGGRIVGPLLGACNGRQAAESGDGEDCEEECGEA